MDSWGEPRSKRILPVAPIGALTNYRIVRATKGEVVFAGTPDESVYNPIGMVHGGYVCTALDTVTACAVHSTLPKGVTDAHGKLVATATSTCLVFSR